NADFPYAEQDTTKANDYAHAYNLTKITLPSGGEIKVDYEANHYAFTQNRRAMEMIEVAGAGDKNSSYPGTTNLFKTQNSPPALNAETGNNRIYLKLHKTVSSKAEFFEKYLRGAFGDKTMADGYLYFRFLTRINSVNSPVPGGKYEYVPGYVQVDDYDIGFDQASNQAYGYLDIRHVGVQDFNLPPKIPITIPPVFYTSAIAKTAWQFTRIHLPKVAYGNTLTNTPQNFGQQVVTELANTVAQMKKFVVGFNNSMLIDRFSQEFVPEKSWMRLCSPEGDKIAGGSRVKSIRISDVWDKMDAPNGKTFEYGQTYDYTTVENGKTISSGVAAYEPALGGDENPFRQPQIYSLKPILAPATEYIQEEPFGESFFPSAQIVYSKVTVKNLQHPNVKRTATGAVVHEFFTARDFPTITENTGAKSIQKKTKGILKQLLLKHKDYMTATEGFVIELNDMHGKPKKQSVFDEGGTKISGVEYRYKHRGNRLVNERIPVVNTHGVIENATIGLEFSMFTDSREMFSKTRDMGLELNSDNFLLGFWPFISVIPLPTYHVEETRFRSMVTMKVVQRYGILDETIAYDLGASVSTKNLAFDAETGEVLLTETSNEFEDPIFNFNIPAHWAYEGMRGAYQNLGAEFSGVSVTAGIYNAPLHYFFTPGDEIIEVLPTTGPTNPQKFWVKDVDRSTGEVYLIDEYGYPIPAFFGRIKIVRSGARNQQMSSIGSVTSLRKPFNNYGDLDFNNKEIINASATEFSDRWQTWCSKKMKELPPCKCKESQAGIQMMGMLNSQISGGQFMLRPKTSPLPLSAGQFPQFQQLLDNECNLNYPGSQYWLAIELVGNALVISFGKSYSDLPPCWKECLVIPGFGILLNPPYGPAPTVQQFINLKPDLSACDGKGFCFSAKVLTYFDQNGGNLSKTPFAAVFNFCGQGNCFPSFNCEPASPQSLCDSKIVNPYRTTNRGVFRPLRSWAYLTDRKQAPAGVNIRVDGAFNVFSSFWTMPQILSQTGIPPIWESKKTDWTWTSEVTRYNPIGNELENRDPLDRYAAELTGYAHTQVTATAKNARYRQIAFDGFEDYEFDRLNNLNPCIRRHFGFDGQLVKRDTSHSGKYALQLAAGANTVTKDTIVLPACTAPLGSKPANQPFMLDECDCVGVFSPDPGKYVFSAWVRESRDAFALNFNQASVTISDGVLTTQTFKAEGPIIEGWQRISGEFEISTTAKNIEIKLNAAPDVPTWFDDVRAHPFDASFKSFVYDDVSLRFTYELDENNFFTKYEYDQQGALERVKKETIRGVMTLKDVRFGQKKN
ncbi:MAG: hypothetical protein H7246_07375, partial [Phycisphaerae bacterium]|nr:hypothetical protein [Saprospiraceae bacterium]